MNDGNEWLGDGDERGLNSGHLDKLDGLIEQALGSYTAREPRAGLESRVLSSIAAAEAESARRHGWSWKPAWALAAAMALMAVVGIPLGYRLGRQETAVVHRPEIYPAAAAEVRHSAPAAPLSPLAAPLSAPVAARRTFIPHGRVADAEPEGIEIAANAGPVPVERVTTAPMDGKRQTDEPDTLRPGTLMPIMLKPITIAPIQIQALN